VNRSHRGYPRLQREWRSLPASPLQACPSRRRSEARQTHQEAVAGLVTMEPSDPSALPQHEQQTRGQLIWAANVNSLPLDKMLKVVVTVVEQIVTECHGAA
jgi:aminoglycoside phosphotransferase